MTTASAWKNFRLAFSLSVGTCLSAASNKSVAPFGRFGIPNVMLSEPALLVTPETPVLDAGDTLIGA